ncbi:MAG TPA: hypothetical protein VK212_06760 [Lentimicrobium sp.]|nr:hypothetical protein [Lentimicrobium sp.]
MAKHHIFTTALLILLALNIALLGCKKEESDPDTNTDPPTISLSNIEASGLPGSNVGTTVSINASEGIKKLVIYKNGAVDSEVSYNFETTASHDFNYTIEQGLAAGTIVNFSFEAIDSLDKKSEQKTFSVTVEEITTHEIVQVTDDITANTTWTSDKIWEINNIVRVPGNVTLTIEAGTVIFGDSDTKGTLLIERGGKLIADGTFSSPIIFTSDKPVGSRNAGDWSGIVICGKAPVNQGNLITLEGNYGAQYGGSDEADNSGILRHVRIEFAGRSISNNQEINSLTLAGVGNGTTIEYIQCSFGLDDSYEFFGGTVNAKYLVSYKTKDDDFDLDFGHAGNIQFALAVRGADIADVSYSNGIEADNDGAGTISDPFTQTVFANVSIIGAKNQEPGEVSPLLQTAAHFRRNSMPTLYNSFLTGFPVGIFIDDTKPGSSQHALDNDLQIRNVILAGVENWGNNNWGGTSGNEYGPLRQANPATGFDIDTWFGTSTFNNLIKEKWQDAGIDQSIYTSTNPKLTPNAGSILLTAGKWDNTPKATGSFFEKVAFAGAFGNEDWTSGWCNWDPQNVIYQ